MKHRKISFPCMACVFKREESKAAAIAMNASKAEVKKLFTITSSGGARTGEERKKKCNEHIKLCLGGEEKQKHFSLPFTSDALYFYTLKVNWSR
jgi:hypothetical protein